ncbi:MAG: hypothetical protein HFH86_04035 [Bacilli bacterium]|nr:hypothetical protein [Bacilli bacterium]
MDYNNTEFVNTYKFIMEKEQKDGSIFKDRAFSNVYVYIFNGDYDDFYFDDNEVSGIAIFQ